MRDAFDPSVWRESQRRHLDELLASEKVDPKTYQEALDEVERRYGEMVKGLQPSGADGSGKS